MKKCNECGAQLDDQTKYCPLCGAKKFTEITPIVPEEVAHEAEPVARNPQEDRGNGNMIAGFVGAFLFSIIGGLIYFVLYQIGIIAGISGLITFVLANFGYGLFAGTKNKSSIAGLIASIVSTIAMIFIAEYLSISFEIYQVYKEWNITIFDAVRATPEFLTDSELRGAVIKDLVFAYLFGGVACVGNIVNAVKARKNQ